MNARLILLVTFIAIFVLVGCANDQTIAPAAGDTVSGQSVSAGSLRIEDANNTILFTVDGTRVYQGSVQDGQVVLSFDGDTIRRGGSPTGEELFTISGDRVYVGASTDGAIAYTIDADGKVHEGDSQGVVIYTIEDNRVFEGSGSNGAILFDANEDFGTDLFPVLPVLLDTRF